MTLGPGVAIQNQSFAVAIESSGFDGLDGLIGYATREMLSFRVLIEVSCTQHWSRRLDVR